MFLPDLLSQKEQKVGYFKKFFSTNKLHPKFPLFLPTRKYGKTLGNSVTGNS